jgi:hypothetical protein
MGVTVCMPLFGNPGHELEEGAAVKGADLRTLGDELRERLAQAADILDRLAADGWKAEVAMFDLLLSHPLVASPQQAEQRLRAIAIDPDQMMILEDVEEEDVDE